MRRGLDGFFASSRGLVRFSRSTGAVSQTFGGEIARGKHLFPFRTEPLSLSAPMVLGGQPPGRVGRRRSFTKAAFEGGFRRSEITSAASAFIVRIGLLLRRDDRAYGPPLIKRSSRRPISLGLRCADRAPFRDPFRRADWPGTRPRAKGHNVIGAIILGILAGYLARLLMPGKQDLGFLLTAA